MRTYRTNRGTVAERPFFRLAEFEQICRAELERCGLYPTSPSPIRIDRFVEKRFGIQPSYEDLPLGLLGFTMFGPEGVEKIVVARRLDAEGTRVSERRLRSTLAHECGHGFLHAHLFALTGSPTLPFLDGLATDDPKILCREDQDQLEVGREAKQAPYKWWEFQANQAMASLLLPKPLLESAIGGLLVGHGHLGAPRLPEDRRRRAVETLAEIFDVNPVLARLRIEAVYPNADGGQLTL